MAFSFTQADFDGYVKKEEHGGRHVWDELLELLSAAFHADFARAAYEQRGDNLKLLWFHPTNTPRLYWSNQAQFYLGRSVEQKELEFGLMVERPREADVQRLRHDPDLDGARMEALAANPSQFTQLLDGLLELPGWQMVGTVWQTDHKASLADSSQLRSFIEGVPPESGYDITIHRVLRADQAIGLGEDVASEIMRAFRAARPLWNEVIPTAVLQHLGGDHVAGNRSYWWVNQGRTYESERQGGFIWAPQKNKAGNALHHWTNVSKVKTGDVIFHYAKGALRATSAAQRDGYASKRPDHLPTEAWEEDGWRVDLAYEDLQTPIPLEAVSQSLRALDLPQGPINSAGGVIQGYLFALNERAAAIIGERAGLQAPRPPQPERPSSYPKNLILYGPPGTGKTYVTAQIAVEICDGANGPKDRPSIAKRFRALVAEQRVAFVTFHQSYGYEDFVEGIRPILADEGEAEGEAETAIVRYECHDGVFKRICSLAKAAYSKKGKGYEVPEDATVWKMSLGHYRDPRQAYVYDECIEQNFILLGYGHGLDFSGCGDRAAVKKKLQEQDAEIRSDNYHVTSVNMFKNEMRPGDLVIITEGNSKFRAVARVTGDYEPRRSEEYGQMRPVESLAPEGPEDGGLAGAPLGPGGPQAAEPLGDH